MNSLLRHLLPLPLPQHPEHTDPVSAPMPTSALSESTWGTKKPGRSARSAGVEQVLTSESAEFACSTQVAASGFRVAASGFKRLSGAHSPPLAALRIPSVCAPPAQRALAYAPTGSPNRSSDSCDAPGGNRQNKPPRDARLIDGHAHAKTGCCIPSAAGL